MEIDGILPDYKEFGAWEFYKFGDESNWSLRNGYMRFESDNIGSWSYIEYSEYVSIRWV